MRAHGDGGGDGAGGGGEIGGDDERREYGSWEEVEEAAKAGDRAGIPMDGPDFSISSPHASTSPLPFRTLTPPHHHPSLHSCAIHC